MRKRALLGLLWSIVLVLVVFGCDEWVSINNLTQALPSAFSAVLVLIPLIALVALFRQGLAILSQAETPIPEVQAKAPVVDKKPMVIKTPALPTSEPSTDPASALSVARGVGSAAKDFHWLKENIPCQSACPAHTDIPAYLKAIADGRYDEAYDVCPDDAISLQKVSLRTVMNAKA